MDILSIYETLAQHHVLGIFIIIASLVEVSPIKISPLKWIGKRLNADLSNRLTKQEKKLDEHIAQSYRNKILSFQDDLLAGKNKTKEQFKEAINAITCYEVYCEENDISNGLCIQASDFIKGEYKLRLIKRDFLPDLKVEGRNE